MSLVSLKKVERFSPGFTSVLLLPANRGGPPLKGYIHESCSRKAFPGKGTLDERAVAHLLQVTEYEHMERFDFIPGRRNFDYAIAAVWADVTDPVVDLICYWGLRNLAERPYRWPSNPESKTWVSRAGEFEEDSEVETCGDMRIVLGAEEIHRRVFCNDLEEYMGTIPKIWGLEIERPEDADLYTLPRR